MSKLSLLQTTLGIIVNQNADVVKLIQEAHQLGIKVGVYADHKSRVIRDADFKIIGSLTNKERLKSFATQCQLVIYVNGSGISTGLINYLKQFTNVPQGSKALDIVNDRSIQRVFLDALNINSLPYNTIFSLSDVKHALNKLNFPVYLQPVQTSYVQQQSTLITSPDQLSSLDSMFNGAAYILESLPNNARYFKMTVVRSKQGIAVLPIIEEHYNGQKLSSANLNTKLPSTINDQFTRISSKLITQLNYVGALTISFILQNNQVDVDGVELPFNIINNVYNLTPDNVYQMILRSLMGASLSLQPLRQNWLIKIINRNQVQGLQNQWMINNSLKFDLSPLTGNKNGVGYELVSSLTLDERKKKHQSRKI